MDVQYERATDNQYLTVIKNYDHEITVLNKTKNQLQIPKGKYTKKSNHVSETIP